MSHRTMPPLGAPFAHLAALFAGLALAACSGASIPFPQSDGAPSAGVSDGSAQTVAPSGVGASLSGVTGYGSANAFVSTGYSDREVEPGHVEVRAKGSPVTPVARLEKIALARAAEIGRDRKYAFFKAGPFAHGAVCQGGRELGPKAGKRLADRSATVGIDVVYAKTAEDAGYLPTAETFDRLTRELAEETVSPEAQAAAKTAIEAKCGK